MNFKKTKKESLPFFSTLAAGNKGKIACLCCMISLNF